MAGLLKVEVSLHGKIANAAKMNAKAEKAVMAGLLELATMEGQVRVQKELYPGHGFVTGHLFKHIGAAKVGPLTAQFDAGHNRYGANLIYSYWIEGSSPKNVSSSFKGYKMFDRAYQRLATKPNLWKRYVGMRVMRAFR
tara:strand:- start:105 stop:521 length:417 start_codon:yes stop_codon:yes gene_type:complete